MNAWACAVHGITTTGDCPRCDDELIALAEGVGQPSIKCFWCARGACHACLGDGTECPCCALPARPTPPGTSTGGADRG